MLSAWLKPFWLKISAQDFGLADLSSGPSGFRRASDSSLIFGALAPQHCAQQGHCIAQGISH